MRCLLVCVKEARPFAHNLSLENHLDSNLSFELVSFHWVFQFFFIDQPPSFCTVFDAFSPNTNQDLWIKPCANAFVCGDCNVHHKNWLTYSCGTDRPGQLCYTLSISNDLTQMVNFPTRISHCDYHSLLIWIVFVLQWFSLHCEILIILSQFPLS